MTPIRFFVHGTPKPAGSKRVFLNRKTGKPIVVDASGGPGKDWRYAIQAVAWELKPQKPFDFPLFVELTFYLPRPKTHYNTKGNLKPNAPRVPGAQPDALKLARAVEDALSGIIWRDDSIITTEIIRKRYANIGAHGVTVTITEE